MKKVKLKDLAEIKYSIVRPKKSETGNAKWITLSNLQPENVIAGEFEKFEKLSEKAIKITKGDIIIRRVNPLYINYIDRTYENVFAYNNLIIIRAKKIESKYLACILEKKIEELQRRNAQVTLIPSLSRREIEEIEIFLHSKEEQVAIGETWFKGIEKRKMKRKLLELEGRKEAALIDKYLREKGEK
ncbi:MAG: restriction endonuclease subunit S [Anaerovoracaceae bacterium]